jgi:thiol-disulfide isomerase/thioredoxin
MLHRRAALTGLGTLALSDFALAADKKKPAPSGPPLAPLFAGGPLAGNLLAAEFKVPNPHIVWPKRARLVSPEGKSTTIEAYRGKLLLVALWAEWCTPCLTELPGIAYHARKSNNDRFAIVPILTASQNFETPREAAPFLEKIGAMGLPTLADGSNDGDELARTLAQDPEYPSARGALPCMLIVDPAGEIRGRAIGGQLVTTQDLNQKYNLWSTSVSVEFIAALATGQLG